MRRKTVAAILLAIATMALGAKGQSITDYVEATISTPKHEIYVGEAFDIILTVKAHSVNLGQDFSIAPLPDDAIRKLPGALSQYPVERRLNGDQIEDIRKFSWRAVAISNGTVNLSTTLELAILSRSTSLFFSRPQKSFFKIPVTGPALSVKSLPLQGRPSDFSGAVGSFSLDVDVSPKQAAPGDVVKIRTEVKGEGLLENVKSPLLGHNPALKVYESKQLPAGSTLISEQQVVPQSKDALLLPGLSFTFFEPATGQYKTLRHPPTQLQLRDASVRTDAIFRPDDPEASSASSATSGLPTPPLSIRVAGLMMAVAALLLVIAILRMRSNRQTGLIGLAGVAVLMLIAGGIYLQAVRSGYFEREIYLVSSQQRGMSAPSRTSRQTMLVPPRSYVQYLSCEGAWVLVKYIDRYCWLPEESLEKKVSN